MPLYGGMRLRLSRHYVRGIGSKIGMRAHHGDVTRALLWRGISGERVARPLA